MGHRFASWCELEAQIIEDLAQGAFGAMQSYSVSTAQGTRSVTYRSAADARAALEFVRTQCALEKGTAPYVGRTRAGNGGRG